MPEDLGKIYVWDNVPEYTVYVVKDGKSFYSDKIVVGMLRYATPVFSADISRSCSTRNGPCRRPSCGRT